MHGCTVILTPTRAMVACVERDCLSSLYLWIICGFKRGTHVGLDPNLPFGGNH